jgi:hypothetical protein
VSDEEERRGVVGVSQREEKRGGWSLSKGREEGWLESDEEERKKAKGREEVPRGCLRVRGAVGKGLLCPPCV